MKKKTLAGLAVCLILLLIFFLQNLPYRVKADNSNLVQQVNLWLNRDAGGTSPYPEHSIIIYDTIDFGTERYVLMEVDGQLGQIHLLRGLTGAYKIDFTSHGSGNFLDRIVEHGDETYLLFAGRNAYFGIQRMTFSLDGREYSLTIPETTPFFLSAPLDPGTQSSYLDLGTVRFYDAAGSDITQQVPWN